MAQVEALVEGGKASAGPPLGPALGPLGVNIGQIIGKINEKTKDFEGMQVPVKVLIDEKTKKFEVKVGTPPVSAMFKKELNLKKLSGNPKEEKVADVLIEQIIKISKSKMDDLNTRNMKSAVKQVVGSCVSAGLLVEGKDPREVIKEIDEGKFDQEILQEKTELTEEEKKKLEEEKEKFKKEIEKRHKEERQKAEEILKEMEGKERGEVKTKLTEAGISKELINELLKEEKTEEKK